MSLITQKLGLLNGVSQRPHEQRLSSQAQAQVNGLSHLVRGLMKRPPLVWVGQLTTTLTGWSSAFIHPIVRDASEQYHVAVVNGQVKVYSAIDQTEKTVTARGGYGYLSGGTDFRFATAGDTTVIVNRDKTVTRGTTKSAAQVYEALIFVRQADFATLYSVTIDGKTVGIKTIDQATSATREAIGTDTIAANLMTELTNAFSDDFNFTQYGSTIHIQPIATGKDFALSVTDGLADNGLKAVKGAVQLFEDLPSKAPDGFIIEVAGDPESDKDNYWLRFDSKGNDSADKGHWVALNSEGQEGVWRECPKPGTLLSLDASTLPHRLTRKGSIVHDVTHEGIAAALLSVTDTVRNSGLTTYDWSNFIGGSAITAGANATVQDNAAGMYKVSGVNAGAFNVVYYIDTTQLPVGEQAQVRIYVNSTTVYTAKFTNSTDQHNWGILPFDHLFQVAIAGQDETTTPPPAGNVVGTKVVASIQHAVAVSDTIKIELTYMSGTTPSTYRRASLAVTSGSLTLAGSSYKRIYVIGTFPAGTQASTTLDGTNTFTYTVGSTDETAAQVATGLKALVDASPLYVVTANSASTIIDIKRADGAAFSDATVSTTFDESLVFHNSTLSLTTNELAGKTMKNLTDGSSGTISSNSATTVTLGGSLSGGADNKFQRGDICSVVGSGTYFVFEPCPWNDRGAGDDVTNPFPSFVDNTISDVVFYQNRLGFTSNENVIFSCSGDLFNFFRFTATQLLADDVIDVRSASRTVALFDAFVIWGGALYAKSNNAQWLISGDPVLTPTTVRIDPVSYVLNDSGLPAVLGNRMYLFRGKGGYTQVQEFVHADSTVPKLDFIDLTQDNPRYLPGSPVAMVGDDTLGFLAVLTDDSGQQNLYVYSYAFQGDQRAQSSWSQWTFASGQILGMDIVDGKLGLIVLHTDSVQFYTIDLNVALDTLDADEKVRHLDRRYTEASSGVSASYSAGPDTTTWTLPVAIATDGSEGTLVVTNRTTNVTYAVTRPAANQVAVTGQGDLSAANVYIGVSYTFSYTPSTFYVRLQERPETGGWLIVRNLKVNYRDSTDFVVTVTVTGRAAPWTYTFSSSTPSTDEFRVPVQGRNKITSITLSNPTAGGCAFTSLDWEGSFTMRSRRI